MANELKKFREEKMRRLEEQLKLFLENKRTKNTSRNFDPFQNSMKECSHTKAFSGKDFCPDLLKLIMRPEEDKKEREMQQNNSPLSPVSESFWVPGTHHKADDQLLLFLTHNIKVLKQAEHLMASRIVLLNPQFTTSSLYGGDKIKCIKPSFLLDLLNNVNDELQSHAVAAGLLGSQTLDKKTATACQDIEDAMMTQEGELTVVDPATLSRREFVVYQYGISILRFLKFHMDAPEIHLCVASSIPLTAATGNAFRNSFFYQNTKNKLFILRDCLSSVGSFLLLLVHCVAHIAAADFNHDASPRFLRLFHQAVKACLSEMFCLRLQLSALLQGDKPYGISQMLLKEEPFSEEEIKLISQLFEVKVKSVTDTEAFEKVVRKMKVG
ncbi:uncharacterized protein LOC128854346 [Cuculus canorus]|uniref:uncharacterized protein LOC128854346 n=1 Tax=Cuculus canorus TaxID=55661 RepID=UPI0023AB1C5A|nr:uncharacterized protein LOC128854346 [Cuculus canorus]